MTWESSLILILFNKTQIQLTCAAYSVYAANTAWKQSNMLSFVPLDPISSNNLLLCYAVKGDWCNVAEACVITSQVCSHVFRRWSSKKRALSLCHLSCAITLQFFSQLELNMASLLHSSVGAVLPFVGSMYFFFATRGVECYQLSSLTSVFIDRVATDHNQDNTTIILRDWLVKVQNLYHYVEWRPKEKPT